MRNKIYYLLDFHKKCCEVNNHGEQLINKYCDYVNSMLDKYFSIDQQIQLKLRNFNSELLYKFSFDEVDDISFDGLDDEKLDDFFDKISFVSIKAFYSTCLS